MLHKISLLGVDITSSSEDEILEYITKRLQNKGKKWYVVTPNPEMVVAANKSFSLKTILNNAEIALPDGVGVVWGGRLLKKDLKSRITGTDLMVKVCEKIEKKPIMIGFLGGGKGIAKATAECLHKTYPGLTIGFVGESWPESVGNSFSLAHENSSSQSSASNIQATRYSKLPSSSEIRRTKQNNIQNNTESSSAIDLLFVAFGFPKQEKWIYENLDKIPVRCAMGVGGAFDFISGKVSRAPKFIQSLGLEWLFRLVVQPWRWKRQLALIMFVWLVVREKFNHGSKDLHK